MCKCQSHYDLRNFNRISIVLSSWFYRIQPSVVHDPFVRYTSHNNRLFSKWSETEANPNQIRWKPFHVSSSPVADFVDGLFTIAGAGDPKIRHGISIHVYMNNKSMKNRAFCNSDGDFLIVPQQGSLTITTEFGKIFAEPNEIVVVQQGMKFKIEVEGESRGYILEIYDNHFVLPHLGPIGANGLANPRHFLTPVASFESSDDQNYEIVYKFQGELFACKQNHTPFDVVAWTGNYVPYKYE